MDARDRFIDVLRSRRMMQPGEEWVIDTNLNAITREAVVGTLRAVAEQTRDDEERDRLLATAEQVESGLDDACCPLCQEVTCDTGCPLGQTRRALDRG